MTNHHRAGLFLLVSLMAQRRLQITISVDAAQAAAQITGLNNALNGNTSSTKAAGAAAGTAAAGLEKLKGMSATLQNQMDQSRRTAYAFTIAGYQVAAAGRAITSSLMSSFDAFKQFDFNSRRAAGALEIFDTNSSTFKELETSVKNVAAATGLFDPATISKGLYFWASTTGQVVDQNTKLADIMEQLDPVMKAAMMTDTDMETAIKGVISVAQEYNLSMSSVSDITEKLFYVAQKTASEFPDLINSLKMLGPVAAQMGISLDDTLQLLGALANAGIKGTMAGRALRQMFRQFSRETPMAASALDSVTQAALGTSKSFQDIVNEGGKFNLDTYLSTLANATKGLGDAQKAYLFATISTAAEMPALIQLVNEESDAIANGTSILGEAGLNLDDASSNFQNNWKMMSESATAEWGKIQNAIMPVILDIGQAFTNGLKMISPFVTQIAKFVSTLLEANPTLTALVVAVVSLAGVIATLGGALFILMGGFKLFTGTVFRAFTLEVIRNAIAQRDNTEITMASAKAAIAAAGAKDLQTKAMLANTAANLENAASTGTAAAATEAQAVATTTSLAGKLKNIIIGSSAQIALIAAAIFVAGFAAAKDKVDSAGQKLLDQTTSWAKKASDAELAAGKASILNSKNETAFNIPILSDMLGAKEQADKAADAVTKEITLRMIKGLDTTQLKAKADEVKAVIADLAKSHIGDPKWFQDNAQALHDYQVQFDTITGAVQGQADLVTKMKMITGQISSDAEDMTSDTFDSFVQLSGAVSQGGKVVGITLDKMSTDLNKRFFKSGEDAVHFFNAGFYKDTSSFTGDLNNMIDLALGQINNTDTKFAESGTASLSSFIKGWYDSADANVAPATRAVADMANTMLQSANPQMRQNGLALMESLALAIRSGNTGEVAQAINFTMSTITGLMQSSNPAMNKEGANMMIALAQGIKDAYGPTSYAAAQMDLVIAELQSADPAAWQTGYGTLATWAAGAQSALPVVGKALDKFIDMLTPVVGLDPTGIAGIGLSLLTKIKGQIASQIANMPKVVIPNYTPKAPKTSKSSGSGSGGSSSSTSNPLQDALTTAQNGVALATALKSLEGVDLKGLVQSTMGSIAEAVALSVTITLTYAKKVSTADLTTVSNFSNTVSAVAGAIGSAATAFAGIDPTKIPVKSVMDSIIATMSGTVTSMAVEGKKFKAADLANASDFGTVASTVFSAIGSAIDALAKFPTSYVGLSDTALDSIVEDIGRTVRAMADVAPTFSANEITVTDNFSNTASAVVGAVASAISAFSGLANYIAPMPETVQSIVDAMSMTIAKIKVAATNANLSTDDMTKLTTFATLAKAVADAISATYSAFNQTIQFVDQFRERVNLDQVFADMDASVGGFIVIANKYGPDAVKAAGDLAATASSIATAIEAFWGLGANASHDPDVLSQQVQQALDAVMATVASFISSFKDIGASMIQNLVAGIDSQESLLVAEMAKISGDLSLPASPLSVVTHGEAQNVTITHVIKDPDGALKNANAQDVATLLSGSQFISNLQHAVATQ